MTKEFKLKDLTSLDLKDGDKVEAEVEGIDGGKVLLIKMNGKVSGINANCSHFGAPLKNGVLTPDGRLTCPWHGACFNTTTGDVEDAPAPDPLGVFSVSEKDGGIYVKGEESHIKNGKRGLDVKVNAADAQKVVIVGGGSGTFGAFERLRTLGYKGAITILTGEDSGPIDRTKLSKALIPDASKLALRSKEWYSNAAIDIVPETVTTVDFSKKIVTGKSGKTYDYTSLILAPGGTPKKLPMPGFKKLDNIFVLRNVGHVNDILAAAPEGSGKKIVVVGSSFIGMEVGNALAGKKHDVTIIGMERTPLERVMGEKVGSIFQKLLEKSGVKFRMDASVDDATPSSSDSSKVGGVKLKDGTTLEADLVILGVGVAPATEFLKDSGVDFEKDGSLKTDENFAVEGLKDVYAIGDIATYPYHGPGGDGTPTRIEHWNVAQNAGKRVAAVLTSNTPKPFIPIFWSALGSQLRYCGATPNGYDDIVLTGEPDEAKFVAYYCKGETVVAVATMMKDPVMTKCAELMRRGKMPTKTQLKDQGVDVLTLDLPVGYKI